MLGFVHLPLLVASGCILALGSLFIQGDQTRHWVFGWLSFTFAGASLLAAPSLVESLPQAMSPLLFLISGVVCILCSVMLFHPAVRSNFGHPTMLEDELEWGQSSLVKTMTPNVFNAIHHHVRFGKLVNVEEKCW